MCTGALILGAAGSLDSKRATTHWTNMDTLAEYGAIPTKERVIDGDLITAAGVSSGIEYDLDPPFDCGSIDKAGPEIVELTLGLF